MFTFCYLALPLELNRRGHFLYFLNSSKGISFQIEDELSFDNSGQIFKISVLNNLVLNLDRS